MPIWVLFLSGHLSNSEIAILTSWLFAAVLIFELPTGVLADLLGKKAIISIGLLISMIVHFIYPFVDQFWYFFIVFTFLALGEALESGANEALVYDSLKEDKKEVSFKKVNGNLQLLTQIGFVIANVAGGWLYSLNATLPFVISGFTLCIAFLFSLKLKEPSIDSEVFTLKNYLKQTKDGFLQLTKHKWIFQLGLLYVFVGGISWVFQRLVNLMVLTEVGISAIAIGLIMGGFRLFNVLALKKIVSIKWLEKSGLDFLLLPFLMVASYLPAYWSGRNTTVLLVGGAMIAATGRFMILNPYLNEMIDSKYRATTLSALNMLVSLVLIVSILISGPLIDMFGSKLVMTLFGVFSLVVIVPLSLTVYRRRKRFLSVS
jgi:MFS family permease